MAYPPAGKTARRLGNHGRCLDGGHLRCNSPACRVTLWSVHVSPWSGMKFGFGSSAEKTGIPHIERVAPAAAIPGGEITIHGRGFVSGAQPRPVVRFGEAEASIALASENRLVARVPEGANGGVVRVATAGHESQPHPVHIGLQIADNLHPVANPAVDLDGNIYVTFSGPRGQRVPVSLYKITANYSVKPFITSLMNPSGLALDRMGNLFVSCRSDGTVFKISPSREIFVFATLEPSIAAYHLAFHPSGDLYVSGPTTSSFDRIHRITQGGDVSVFFRGLGRPQGLALDRDGNLYVAGSYGGRRGIVRITPQAQADIVLSGSGIVGMALQPSGRAILATTDALFTLDWDVRGLPLIG